MRSLSNNNIRHVPRKSSIALSAESSRVRVTWGALIVRLFTPHSPLQPPRGFRLPLIHPHSSQHTCPAMAATHVSTYSFPTHAVSPSKLAVNGHSTNHTADRIQIVNDEKQFTYVPMQVLCYQVVRPSLQTRLERPNFCLASA